MGSLFLRKRLSHGRTEIRWVAKVRMPDGTMPTMACPHQHSARDRRSCPEAEENLATLLRIRDEQLPLDLRNLSVGAYLTRWVKTMTADLAPATVRQHEMIIRVHLEPAFRSRLLTGLKPSDVDAYLARKRLDPQTLRHHRATLRRALADAVRAGYLLTNPVALSRAPRMDKPERHYLTGAQAHRLIDETREERFWPVWTVLVTTGLRLAEALGLTWADVDLDAGSLTVRRTLVRTEGRWAMAKPKTRKSRRTVTLIPQAIDALREQRRRQDEDLGSTPRPIHGLVFTSRTGEPVYGPNVLRAFERVRIAQGLPKVTLHDLRHSCATIMLGAGVPLPVIAEQLGHSSIRVTADLYAHVIPELRQDAARKLSEAIG